VVEERVENVRRMKAAVTDESYDIRFLAEMRSQMNLRQDLWKCFQVSTLAVQEWKAAYFRKVSV